MNESLLFSKTIKDKCISSGLHIIHLLQEIISTMKAIGGDFLLVGGR